MLTIAKFNHNLFEVNFIFYFPSSTLILIPLLTLTDQMIPFYSSKLQPAAGISISNFL